MAKSIAFAADASRLAALLLSYIPVVCAFVAPCQPGASTAIIDRLTHSRALSHSRALIASMQGGVEVRCEPAQGCIPIDALFVRTVRLDVIDVAGLPDAVRV